MVAHAIFYGIALVGNCAIVTGTGIFSPLKVDPSSVRLYKSEPRSVGNDLEYTILKRGPQDAQESPDSKERRSQMGSSFIRFGRNRYEGNLENADFATGNEILDSDSATSGSSSRTARGRSDVIIRFGRSDLKNTRGPQQQRQLSSGDIKFLRYGTKPLEALRRGNDFEQLALVCSNILASTGLNDSDARLYLTKLVRLCNSLGLGIDENYETRRNSKVIEILEDAPQGENLKHE